MKIRLAFLATLGIAAACAPAGAHHLTPHGEVGYLAFWKGIPAGKGVPGPSDSPEYWKKAFVSKYSLVGFENIQTSL